MNAVVKTKACLCRHTETL